ncbi:Asp-tRNA(Asn)/Glu-tRNA(Gln) amidotransferase subunit GatC [bacterium]|nr:MAG: Asp-tRNA(Asn)/Glu-tRNA(Gln) amidotransferase subunit GatC [bacterium]
MIDKLARLALLNLKEDEKKRLQKDIERILEHINQLKEVDVEGIPPTYHPEEMTIPLREDEPVDSGVADSIIQQAPEIEDKFIIVERVVRDEP